MGAKATEKETNESGLLLTTLKVTSLMRRDEINEEERLPITVVGASTVPDTSTVEKLNYVVSTLQKQEMLKEEKGRKVEKPPLKCFYCHEGHFKRDCPKRPPPCWYQERHMHQHRSGWDQIRGGLSGYRGVPIKGRRGYQIRRPWLIGQPDEIDEELQQPH